MKKRFNSSKGLTMAGEATAEQIEYETAIHDLLGVELPEEKTKQAYSDYICRYVVRYKSALREDRTKTTGGNKE